MASATPAAEIAERRGQLARQTQRLDIKLQGARAAQSTELECLGDDLRQLAEGLHAERTARELFAERRRKEALRLEATVLGAIEELRSGRAAATSRAATEATASADDVADAIQKEAVARTTQTEAYVASVEREVNTLSRRLEDIKKSWSFTRDHALESLEREVAATRKKSADERARRMAGEQKMLPRLEALCRDVEAKLEEEREQRTGTEEVLLKLLDDTCNRLESGAV